MRTGAKFSDCKKYRYSLWRIWDDSKPLLGFCMLNPSTADAVDNDPTIERCCRRAEMNGYGGVIVANIFAYRSTDPSGLKKAKNPVGIGNDLAILCAFADCETVICGWGKHGSLWGRGEEVLRYLTDRLGNNRIRALKINKDGSPAHPLYIGYDVKPIPIDVPKR